MSRSLHDRFKNRIWYILATLQEWNCAYCGGKMTPKRGLPNSATKDHIQPESKGGESHIGNYVAACFECNNRKGDIEDFIPPVRYARHDH